MNFDLRDRSGTAFHLYDSFATGALGIACAAKAPKSAFLLLARAMQFVVGQVEAADKAARGGEAAPDSDSQDERSTLRAVHGTIAYIASTLQQPVESLTLQPDDGDRHSRRARGSDAGFSEGGFSNDRRDSVASSRGIYHS